ncbi:hypothetical protein LPJ55_002725 [Coemansia sp. RSA 990]|nr:hypothetical protein LPJ55_002725 [Coemansia sp. RSA 990]
MYSLYSWSSPFESEGLYSFDSSCISIQTYLQLSKAEWQLHQVNNTNISPSGCLPALLCPESVVESGFWRSIQSLKNQGINLDAHLDQEQIAQSTAYISVLQDGLADALLFSWYLVSENFVETIRPRLAKLFGFPMSLVLPTQLQEHAVQRLKANGVKAEVKDDAAETSEASVLRSKLPRIYLLAKEGFQRHSDKSAHPIYEQAKEHLNVLSQKLASKRYFFGDAPSTLDTVAYGYLAPILRVDLPQNTLKTIIIEQYPNLAALCNRIHEQLSQPPIVCEDSLLAGIGSIIKHAVSWHAAKSASPKVATKDPHLAEKVRFVTGGMMVFFGYIIYNGILSAPASKGNQDESSIEGLESRDVLSVIRNI